MPHRRESTQTQHRALLSSRGRITRCWLPVLFASVALTSCGGSTPEPLPLLEAMIIDPHEIDWEAVLLARDELGTAASDFPFSNYGDVVAIDHNAEPQFTYYVPVGTKARSPVTGTVVRIAELYSGDHTIQIGVPGHLVPVWEVEHVKDLLVAEGDQVVAGQHIASASNAACLNGNQTYCNFGIAVVELGLLTSAGHECPFASNHVSQAAAASIDAEHDYMLDTVRGLLGEPMAFDHSGWETPRCRTLEIVDPR